jgi:hypothetical protein
MLLLTSEFLEEAIKSSTAYETNKDVDYEY